MWAKLRKNALQLLKKEMYAPISTREAQETLQNRSLGTSKLRLVPKKSGLFGQHASMTYISGFDR